MRPARRRLWSGIDPATNEIVRDRITVAGSSVSQQYMAVGEGAVWVPATGGVLQKIDPATSSIDEIDIARFYDPSLNREGSFHVAVGGGSVWVADTSGKVVRVDAANGEVLGQTADVGWNVWDMDAHDGTLWISQQSENGVNQVQRIDLSTGQVVGGPILLRADVVPARSTRGRKVSSWRSGTTTSSRSASSCRSIRPPGQ